SQKRLADGSGNGIRPLCAAGARPLREPARCVRLLTLVRVQILPPVSAIGRKTEYSASAEYGTLTRTRKQRLIRADLQSRDGKGANTLSRLSQLSEVT